MFNSAVFDLFYPTSCYILEIAGGGLCGCREEKGFARILTKALLPDGIVVSDSVNDHIGYVGASRTWVVGRIKWLHHVYLVFCEASSFVTSECV